MVIPCVAKHLQRVGANMSSKHSFQGACDTYLTRSLKTSTSMLKGAAQAVILAERKPRLFHNVWGKYKNFNSQSSRCVYYVNASTERFQIIHCLDYATVSRDPLKNLIIEALL